MWNDLFTALALVLVIEGVMPFADPDGIKKLFSMAAKMDNAALRFAGITSMLLGVILLYLIR